MVKTLSTSASRGDARFPSAEEGGDGVIAERRVAKEEEKAEAEAEDADDEVGDLRGTGIAELIILLLEARTGIAELIILLLEELRLRRDTVSSSSSASPSPSSAFVSASASMS